MTSVFRPLAASAAACAICLTGITATAAAPASAAVPHAAPQAAASSVSALAPRGQAVFLAADARFGVTNSASVKRLQKRLIKARYATSGLRSAGATGSYLKQTKKSVRVLQRSMGFTGSGADGIIGASSAGKLGLAWTLGAGASAPVPSAVTSVPSSPGTALSGVQLKSVLQQAGFSEPSIRTAWALAKRESGGYPAIVGPTNTDGTRDHGLFQINDVHRSWADFTRIYDPVYNASLAFQMSARGTQFSDWGIGDQGWAGTLKKKYPKTWQDLQDKMESFRAQYPG